MEPLTLYRHRDNDLKVTAARPAPIAIPTSIGLYGAFEKKLRATIDRRESSSVEEYVRYFNAPLAGVETNALAFWKAHQFDYPILSAMAKDYLTIQASSVSAERAFSSGTDLVTADRCSLSGKSIEMTQFLQMCKCELGNE